MTRVRDVFVCTGGAGAVTRCKESLQNSAKALGSQYPRNAPAGLRLEAETLRYLRWGGGSLTGS